MQRTGEELPGHEAMGEERTTGGAGLLYLLYLVLKQRPPPCLPLGLNTALYAITLVPVVLSHSEA